MKNKILLFLLLSTILLSKIGLSQVIPTDNDWIFVANTHNKSKFYIKSSPISVTNEGIKIWTKMIWSDANSQPDKREQTRVLVLFNCKLKQQMQLNMIVYDINGIVIGKIKDKPEDREWVDIIPDSVMDGALEMVCHLFNNG